MPFDGTTTTRRVTRWADAGLDGPPMNKEIAGKAFREARRYKVNDGPSVFTRRRRQKAQ